MDKETHDVEDVKNPGNVMEEVASNETMVERGKSNDMLNAEEVNADSDKDDKDLHEEIGSENLSVQGTGALDVKEKAQEVLVQDINEQVKEKEQPEEVLSLENNPPVSELKNEETSDDESENPSESPIPVETKVTESQEKKTHEDAPSEISDRRIQLEEETDVEIREVEIDDHEKKDEVNELSENLSLITDNLDAKVETEKKAEVTDCEKERELLEDLTVLIPETLKESLVSENEIDQPEAEKREVVKREYSSENTKVELTDQVENNNNISGEEQNKESESVFEATKVPDLEVNRSGSSNSMSVNPETPATISETAVAFKNFVKQKSSVAVSSFIRRLSGKRDDTSNGESEPGKEKTEDPKDDDGKMNKEEVTDSALEPEAKESSQKTEERSTWNPLSFLIMSRESESKAQVVEVLEADPILPIAMKGRIVLYTRLGCQECKETRLYLHHKRLGYVEVNIDVYPSRKSELEKLSGSSSVPKIFFNEVLIGGLNDLKILDESGKLGEKIDLLIAEAPSIDAPLPPLSGEDDESNNGTIDENALFVRKMRDSIVVRDRFYGLRRYTNCFLGSDAVNFISEDQYLEREEVCLIFTFTTLFSKIIIYL